MNIPKSMCPKGCSTGQFLEVRKYLNRVLQKHKDEINILYTKLVREFERTNTKVRVGKVYEIGEGRNKRGYVRFVAYTIETSTMGGDWAFIRVGGYWLNKANVPEKWDTLTVYGVGNPSILVLSKNQTALPHPNSLKTKTK